MKRILPLLLLLSISGCASVGDVSQVPPQVNAADQMLAAGHPREAAQSYSTQAESANGPLHDVLEERAANAWQVAGDTAAARRAFAATDPRHLNGDDALSYRLLHAEFAIADGRAAQAVVDLNVEDASVPSALDARWYRAHAIALEASGDRFGAAASLALLEPLQSRHEATATRSRIHKTAAGSR